MVMYPNFRYRSLQNQTTIRLGMIGVTVVQLSERLDGWNPRICSDNIIISFPTIIKMINSGIDVVGTVRTNRIKESNKKLAQAVIQYNRFM